jgi:hypothetical protein
MSATPTPPSGERNVALDDVASMNAARYIARERQKRELRRERDVLVLGLARGLGEQGLAERLGVRAPVIGKLLSDAQARLDAGASPPADGFVVRRLGGGHDRWADADAHYEALGRGPALTDRRRITGADLRLGERPHHSQES